MYPRYAKTVHLWKRFVGFPIDCFISKLCKYKTFVVKSIKISFEGRSLANFYQHQPKNKNLNKCVILF